MKFTKEDACKHLTSKLSEKGHPLHISERSINEMLDTLMPLLANDDTELEDFANSVLPAFRTANLNIKNDVSVGVNKYKEENPLQKPQEKPIEKEEENEETKNLREQLATLQRRLDDADKEKKETEMRKSFISKVKEKGVKDSEWVKSYVSELTIGESFDVEARVEACVKLYNKTKAASGSRNASPDSSGGDGDDGDKYVASTIAKAGEMAKNRRMA